MLWDGISRLVNAEVHVDLALALWLRWIAATSDAKPTQEILAQDKYWTSIQVCSSDSNLLCSAHIVEEMSRHWFFRAPEIQFTPSDDLHLIDTRAN